MAYDNIVGLFQPISALTLWMTMFYFLCDFGDEATNVFIGLSNSIYDHWYLHHVDQQKYFILMILNANKPVYMEGFAIQCTRETFKKVESLLIVFWN